MILSAAREAKIILAQAKQNNKANLLTAKLHFFVFAFEGA
jgi:hypothetical protein